MGFWIQAAAAAPRMVMNQTDASVQRLAWRMRRISQMSMTRPLLIVASEAVLGSTFTLALRAYD